MIRRTLLALAALAVVTAGYFVGREVVRPPSSPPAAPAPESAAAPTPETASPPGAAADVETAGADLLAREDDPLPAWGERQARRQKRRGQADAAGRLAPQRQARGTGPQGFAGQRPGGAARPGGFQRPGGLERQGGFERSARADGAVMALDQAIREQASGAWVEGEGKVERVLRDDLRGRQHQRFVVDLPSGGTLLVAHNTQLAGRAPVAMGDTVRFHGRYEWNPRGGIVHWTHRDPRGRGGGWLELSGRRYE